MQAWRIKRLAEMAKAEGGNASLGRRLGYRDGAFVGQMLRSERPITEKTVAAAHSLPGYAGWFDPPHSPEGREASVEKKTNLGSFCYLTASIAIATVHPIDSSTPVQPATGPGDRASPTAL